MRVSPKIIRLIDEIRRDKAHGASELARQAARVLKVAAERSQAGSVEAFVLEQKEVGERLMSARPAMAPVYNIVSGLLSAVAGNAGGTSVDSLRRFAVSRVDDAVIGSLKAVAQIATHGSGLLEEGDRIMTHSYSSTVLAMLEAAFARYKGIEVVATRGGPGRSGEAMARQLGRGGMAVTFIDDVAAGLYISKVNKAVVGADRICSDGVVVNSAGTYQLALAAERAAVPFYVLGEMLKFDPRLEGSEVDLEEKEPSEVVESGRLPGQVRIRNPYFDITPLELVTGIVTEKGLLTPAEVISYIGRLSGASPGTPGLESP